jgi:phosphoglycolate phosphatase
VKHLFLDFDGTLIDSSEGIYYSYSKACTDLNLPRASIDVFRKQIGPPIQVLAKSLIPAISDYELESLRLRFRHDYDSSGYKLFSWFDGVATTIRTLAAHPMLELSIVTNKPTQPTRAILADAGLLDVFRLIIGIDYRDQCSGGLPFSSKAEALRFALNLADCPAANAVYVGDTLADRNSSFKCGLHFIAATYGFHQWTSDSSDSTDTITSFAELPSCLQRLWPVIAETPS